MKVSFINDWKVLFKKDPLTGRRFVCFTFVNINYMRIGLDTEDFKMDGFTFIVLGLGVAIRP